jgi:hypothetical protein
MAVSLMEERDAEDIRNFRYNLDMARRLPIGIRDFVGIREDGFMFRLLEGRDTPNLAESPY